MNITVEPTGAEWEYRVSSFSTPGQWHIVSLSDNHPYGTCTCPSHICRLYPQHRKTGSMKRCVHLQACRDAVVNYIVGAAIKHEAA